MSEVSAVTIDSTDGNEGTNLTIKSFAGEGPTSTRFSHPTASMVLHQVLAQAARNFVLNDRVPLAEASDISEAVIADSGIRRRLTETDQVHQSRVALRRIRSNLRTFRLMVDPAWSTSLRAELAWYAECLGEFRDLNVLRNMLTINGPSHLDEDGMQQMMAIVDRSMFGAKTRMAEAQQGDRHARLGEQMQILWDGPLFTETASKPALKLMPALLHRSWRDVRGAGRTAKKKPTDDNLHKLRIRLKGLRYGCETVAVVAGNPAAKTARATEKLQAKLGDLHDTNFSITWLEAVGKNHPTLSPSTEGLLVAQHAAAIAIRMGWKKDLKEIERRWHKWQG